MGHPLQFNVYLPPCYAPDAAGGYPVLYMLHGQTFTQDQWVNLGMTSKADDLISNGSIAPFLIIMPFEKDSYAYPFTSGFDKAIVDELIPWVDQTYHTCLKRECRAIGGLSRGGAWAIHLGFTHWQLFGAIGGHSPVPFIGDFINLINWQAQIPAGELPQIYLDIGQNDIYLPNAAEFEQQLTHLGIPHGWLVQPGNHTEAYWQSHVREYLEWYAGFFQNAQGDGGKNE